MANTAHLVRRQSSRDLAPQRSLDRLELKEMRGRLVALENGTSYGATNSAFDDSSPNTKVRTRLNISKSIVGENQKEKSKEEKV